MLQPLIDSVKKKIALANNSNELQQVKVEFLGKQSIISNEMKKIAGLDSAERKLLGQEINQTKEQIQLLLEQRQSILEDEEENRSFANEKLDLTIPARPIKQGSIHPITQATEELIQVFSKFGFVIKDGPNIETDWYNFTALNIDENHPARQMHDTFYLKSGNVLRTHTSPIQIRTMEQEKPPFSLIAPGRTYRSDSDMTHTPMFHQIEGMVIDKNIHFGHFKYVIIEFIKDFFEQANIEIQFRPSFFPFTEPSAEVDIRMNPNDKWLEVLGCGMVHPNVLKNVNIDSDMYQGFAFGLGIERFAMLKYGIKDLRHFFEGDLRWLKHYSFSAFDAPTLAGGLTR
jgi:phenylalanyl-tRNA synthetase alpha chain